MKTQKYFLTTMFLILVKTFVPAQNANSTGNIQLFAQELTKPVCIANAGDSRLFVIEQAGYIRILDSLGNLKPQPFLDIHQRVILSDEQGLLGIAFHPQYTINGYFYVNYIGAGDSTHISRFSVSAGNPYLADPLSEFKLMTIYQPFINHNGGNLIFGPDGYLYIGLGDGGSGGDPGNRAQNPGLYLGKLLRIDVDHGNPYAIPPTNPFYNNADTLGEIWALGLRNPWRFSFDRLTGDLWIGDVGQDLWEEIDYQLASSIGGENYGWRCWEGNHVYNGSGCPPDSVFTFPVYEYSHDPECSVTGGFMYRGSLTSPYYGQYFFADYCSDWIWTLKSLGGVWVKEDFGQFTGNNFSTFGEDYRGRLYIAGVNSGKVYRIMDDSLNSVNNLVSYGISVIQDPFSEKIRIETERNDQPLINLTLCDVSGKVLFKATARANNYEFNTPGLRAGMYILTVDVGGKIYTQKLIRI